MKKARSTYRAFFELQHGHIRYARESKERPIPNACCLTAPSVRLRTRAICPARFFRRASVFKVRLSLAVHVRLFMGFLAILSISKG